MDKLIRNIIIGVVVVLMLGFAYIATNIIPGEIDKINNENAETKQIEVIAYPVADVEFVNVVNREESYTLEKNDDGVWNIKEFPTLNYERTKLESAVFEYANIFATEEVETPANIADFGFDNPETQLTISLKNGHTREILVGNSVAGGKGTFLLDKTSMKSYVVSIYVANGMKREINEYRAVKLAPLTTMDLTKVDITNSNGRVVAEMRPSTYSSELTWQMSYPKHMTLDEGASTALFENIIDIAVISYVEDNPKNLAKYGLNKPKVSVKFESSDGQSYLVHYGKKSEKGYVYTMIDGMDFVFEHDVKFADACEKITAYDLMNKFVNIVNINDIDTITVEAEGKKHILKAERGRDFYIDGKEALASAFRKTYQTIIGIKGNGLAENGVTSQPDYTITFLYTNGESTVTKYCSYDERNYYVEINGERGFITLKKGLETMMQTVEKLAKNPSKEIQ